MRFDAKPVRRTEYQIELRVGPDANDTARFIALAKEQLALIANNGFHGISFR